MKIGLFGGSFDPVHKGHIEIAEAALRRLNLDMIHFLPTKQNPLKNKIDASIEDRLNMLNIALQTHPQMMVNPIELLQNKDVNYTFDTIELLKAQSTDTYYLIIGSDQVNQLDKWHRIDELKHMVQFIAFKRVGYIIDEQKQQDYNVIVLEDDISGFSSTDIRNGYLEGLDENVLSYISSKGLYFTSILHRFLREGRYHHSISVSLISYSIAYHNQLDSTKARVIGYLHDVTKELPVDETNHILEKMNLSNIPAYMKHQYTGAYVAEHYFKIKDHDILHAIACHTEPVKDMGVYDKILYIADKCEPLRGFDSRALIELAYQDIDLAFIRCMESSYDYLVKRHHQADSLKKLITVYKEAYDGEKTKYHRAFIR